MTCVYKEYELKIKMVQEHWLQLKMKFLLGYKFFGIKLGYNMKIIGNKNLVEGVYREEFFQVGAGTWANFRVVAGRGGGIPLFP